MAEGSPPSVLLLLLRFVASLKTVAFPRLSAELTPCRWCLSLPLATPNALPAALLRELVKEMPPAKRLSFQTRVANARTKEAVESLLHDFAPRLECLVLPHARSRDIDLMQVKKVMVTESISIS